MTKKYPNMQDMGYLMLGNDKNSQFISRQDGLIINTKETAFVYDKLHFSFEDLRLLTREATK